MTILPEILNDLRQELAEKQTKEAAWDIIDEYFSFIDLDGIHNELWLLTAGTLTNDEMGPSQKAINRKNLIFFFEFTKMFFEAVHVLHKIHVEPHPPAGRQIRT
jgi:hypothetical protein